MAGNAVIGALRVVLGADTAALEKGLKDAQGSLASFGGAAGKALAAAGVAIAAAATGIAVAIKGSINEADKLSKFSQSIGIPIEELSKLKYAADLSDVGVEALGKSMGKLSKNMVEAASGGAGPAAEAFKAMGIAVKNTDGTLKSSSTVLGEIAGKFAGYEDGAAKTALAIAVFGKAGAAMIPLLNQGKEGLQQAREEAEKYGLVIDKKTGAAAEAFNDNLKRMSAITTGMWTQITAQMLPAFLQLSKVFLENKENSSLLKTAADGLVFTLRALVTAGTITGAVFSALGATLGSVISAIILASKGEFTAAWEALKMGASDAGKAFEGLDAKVQSFWKDADTNFDKIGKSAQTKMAAPIMDAANKAKNALISFLDATQKRTAGLDAEAQTIGKSAYETDRLKIALEALTIAKTKNIPVTEALKQRIDAVSGAFATMSEKAVFGKQLFEQTRTPVEQFGITMENLNGALARGSISWDTYSRGVAQAQDKMVQANEHAKNLGTALESAFQKLLDGGAKIKDILKALVVDFLKLEATSAFKMLLYGNSSQGGTFGGILGSLFGSMPKFATGGQFTVGGAGGVDSQIVAFRASPDERVTIDHGEGRGYGTVDARTSIVVQGNADENTIRKMQMMLAEDRARRPAETLATVKQAKKRRMI